MVQVIEMKALIYSLAVYAIVGLFLMLAVAIVGKIRGKNDFTPLTLGFSAGLFGIPIGIFLWPLWIISQLVEWNWKAEPKPMLVLQKTTIHSGAIGKAITNLNPGGRAIFNDIKVDVVSSSGFLESGKEIIAIEPTPTGLRVKTRFTNNKLP